MKTDEFTKLLLAKLKTSFPPDYFILPEWNVANDSKDDFNNIYYYAPRVDIAIGPFNTNKLELDVINQRFNHLIQENRNFLKKLYKISHLGKPHNSFEKFISRENLNANPRCFIAMEIENTKAAKRALGDIVNAAGMGKVGVVIPLGLDKYRMFLKIIEYFNFLRDAKKINLNLKNVLIIEGSKLIKSI